MLLSSKLVCPMFIPLSAGFHIVVLVSLKHVKSHPPNPEPSLWHLETTTKLWIYPNESKHQTPHTKENMFVSLPKDIQNNTQPQKVWLDVSLRIGKWACPLFFPGRCNRFVVSKRQALAPPSERHVRPDSLILPDFSHHSEVLKMLFLITWESQLRSSIHKHHTTLLCPLIKKVQPVIKVPLATCRFGSVAMLLNYQ